MKKLFLLLLSILISNSLLAQKNNFYKLSYAFFIDESLKHINPETEQDPKKKELAQIAAVAMLFQEENKPIAEAWTSNENIRVSSSLYDDTYQVTNKKTGESFLIDPSNETYIPIPAVTSGVLGILEQPNTTGLSYTIIKGKTKKIANYNCKLAVFEVGIPGSSNQQIEVWFTDKIPSLYWGEYDYLEKIPGVALHISSMGIGIQAQQITVEKNDPTLFEIPAGYTEQEADYIIADNEFEIATDRIAFLDSTSNLYGIKDDQDNIIVEPHFTAIYPYANDQAIATDEDYNYGTIASDGTVVLPFVYQQLAFDENSNMFSFMQADLFGLMDEEGNIVIPNSYEYLGFFNNGYAIFHANELVGLIDTQQKVVVPPTHGYIIENSSTHFIVLDDAGLYALYDIKSNKKITTDYEYLTNAAEDNIYLATQAGKYGFIDATGKVIIPFIYYYATPFEDGVATVLKTEASAEELIDLKGQLVN